MSRQKRREYEAGCNCPLHPCPIHDTPNEEMLRKQFPAPPLTFLPKLDDAIIGVCHEQRRVCYDEARVMELLYFVENMDYDEAKLWLKHQRSVCLVTMID